MMKDVKKTSSMTIRKNKYKSYKSSRSANMQFSTCGSRNNTEIVYENTSETSDSNLDDSDAKN